MFDKSVDLPLRLQLRMFHTCLPSLHHTLELASLVVDGLRNDKLNRLPGAQHNGVSVDSVEKIIHNLRDNRGSPDLPIPDVQTSFLFFGIQQRRRFLTVMNYNVSISQYNICFY